jgi:hypothetical protein
MFHGNASAQNDTEENNGKPVRASNTPHETQNGYFQIQVRQIYAENMNLGNRRIWRETFK